MTQLKIKEQRLELEKTINRKTIQISESQLYRERVLLQEELKKLQSICEHPKLTMANDGGYECEDCGEYLFGEYSKEALSGELKNWKGKIKN